MIHFSQVLKRAAGATLSQNEAELKISMEIHHQMSSTDQAGKIRLAELIINDISAAFSVDEIFWKFPLEIILLPHSVRGSCQLLLSRTDYCDS